MTDSEANWIFEMIQEMVPTPVEKLSHHDVSKCKGEICCIHNPTDHPLRNAKQVWRKDRKIMERICPAHGISHPDPDDLGIRTGKIDKIHGCCGCCRA